MEKKTETKLPEYAMRLGKGTFAGMPMISWQCSKCGKACSMAAGATPSPSYLGPCPSTATRNHIWRKA